MSMNEIALPQRDASPLQPTSLSLSLLLPSPERGLKSQETLSVAQERMRSHG